MPEMLEFFFIDAIVRKVVKIKNKATAITLFFASYILQAMIAVSWTEPVTWDLFEEKIFESMIQIITVTWMLGGIFYFLIHGIVTSERGVEFDFEAIINKIANVPMQFVISLFEQAMKLSFVSMFFGIACTGIGIVNESLSLKVINPVLLMAAPFFYLILTHCLDRIGDFSVKFIEKMAREDDYIKYRETFAGDLLCFTIALFMLGGCIWLQIRT